MKLPPNQGNNQPVKSEKAPSHLEQINTNGAGIDLGSAEHWVCVPSDRAEQNVRRFGCFTPDLMAVADWLIECRVTTVAMEATGVYWIPVFQVLEAKGLEVRLVNAHPSGSPVAYGGKPSCSAGSPFSNSARAQNRCERLSMVAAVTHLRFTLWFIPPRRRNLRPTQLYPRLVKPN